MKTGTLIRTAALGLIAAGMSQSIARAADDSRFNFTFAHSSGATIAVSEPQDEPRMKGTYTIRVFKDYAAGSFIQGVVRPRAGFVLGAGTENLDNRGADEILIAIDTESGQNYRIVEVFSFDGKVLAYSAPLTKKAQQRELDQATQWPVNMPRPTTGMLSFTGTEGRLRVCDTGTVFMLAHAGEHDVTMKAFREAGGKDGTEMLAMIEGWPEAHPVGSSKAGTHKGKPTATTFFPHRFEVVRPGEGCAHK